MNKMTAKMILGVSIAFASVALTVSAAEGPKIQFATPVYDFGKVKSGEPVKYTFIFTNTGDEMLFITNVQPSCGCTTAGECLAKSKRGKPGRFLSSSIVRTTTAR